MSNSLFESLRFRVHVRNLLYDYVKKHCTIDYVTFTETIVSEFFEDAQMVALTDSYSLTLPVDPLDALDKIYNEFPSYSPDDHDVMQVSQETVAYVKEAFKVKGGNCKTERVVMNDSYGTAPPQEPFCSVLTRRTRQNTKKLGSGEIKRPPKLKDLLEEHKLAVLEVEIVEEPKGDLEDTLKTIISIEPGEQLAVKSLLQSTLDTLRSNKPYTNSYTASTFLCSKFPAEPSYTPPEEVFMPIFPRRRNIGISAPATGVELANFKSLVENASAYLGPVDISNSDEDIPRQNMVLVGGWQAIKSSPPSTPSSKASWNDEIDELDDIRFPSSPCTTPPLVQELENSKMDQILIPRSRRIGGNGGITPHRLRGKTLNTFLVPLLSKPRTEREEGPVAERVPSPTPSSLIGQPPSALDIDHDIETESTHFLDFDVDLEIQKVCEGYELEPDFFLDEMVDDKAALLMEVPTLPQPNEFPKDFYVPKSLSELVIPSAAIEGQRHSNPNIDSPLFRFLKKVKGCQSLSLQLSWVPFTTDKQPPTVFEILDVVDLFPQEGANYERALGLLEPVASEPASCKPVADVSIRRGLEAGPEDLFYEIPTEKFWIMLTRKERNHLGKPDESTSVREHANSARGNSDPNECDSLAELQACLATTDTDDVNVGGHSDSSDMDRPLKKPRLYVQDESLLENGSPVDFGACRPAVVDQECDSAAADDGLILSENGDTIWPTTLSQDDGLDYKQNLVQDYTSDISVDPPYARTDGTRHFELPTDAQPSDYLDSRMEPLPDTGDNVTTSRTSRRQSSCDLADFDISKPELSRHSLGSFAFAQLRARKVSIPYIEPAPVEDLVVSPRTVEPVDLRRGPPPEVCDANTIYLEEAIVPQSIHKYMACLELIQKQALVRALRSRNCAIELVDRRDLAGVDLILDTETAVIFLNLFSLPVRCDECVDKIAKGSWKFDRLLIVFEAYGERSAKKPKQQRSSLPNSRSMVGRSSEPYAYTSPIVKALKKFKRNICIAEGCGTKRTATIVQYGFADTVEEAALFTRLYGDWCEASDRTHGAIWGKRDWLDADFLEDEEDHLASLKGFNHFSASIILCQVSLEEFINMLPEERVSTFGAYLLADHIRMCNEDLYARLVAMQTGHNSEVEAASVVSLNF